MANKEGSSLREAVDSQRYRRPNHQFLVSMSKSDVQELVALVLELETDHTLSRAAILRALHDRGISVGKSSFNAFVQDVLQHRGLPDGVARGSQSKSS